MGSTTLVYKGVKFDSDEEVFFAMWCEELQKAGLIKFWDRIDTAIPMTSGLSMDYTQVKQLKTKTKVEKKTKVFLRPSEYTYDFKVCFTEKGQQLLCSSHKNFEPHRPFFTHIVDPVTLVHAALFEIKPAFDQNNMERLFKINQKFLWHYKKIFVNLVEPIELFKKTFLPLEAESYFRYKVLPKKAMAKGKKKGDFKFDWTPKTLKQYLSCGK